MATKPFVASRQDGRSDQEVVFGLVQAAAPETLFSHEALAAALQQGTARTITKQIVCAAARSANRLLLKRQQRALTIVRGEGYRVACAGDHLPLARRREDKATRQIRAGLELLSNCRIDELDPTQRALHQGQLLVVAGLYEKMQSMSKQVSRHDQMIADLIARVDAIQQP